MSRRSVIGKYNDGVNFGVRVSLPGFDALTGDSNGGGFSFDSNWSDISQALMVGTVTKPTGSVSVAFPNQGYVPYCEVRQISGNVVFDDGIWGSFQHGIGAQVTPSILNIAVGGAGTAFLFAIYKIPVMSG
jgi:hypothetical protein